MLGSIHVLPGADLVDRRNRADGVHRRRHAGVARAYSAWWRSAGPARAGLSGKLWRGGLVLVGIVLAWIVLDRSTIRDQMAERRAIESRAAELTVRAMAPGSALACLDAVAGATIETACEKALFASPGGGRRRGRLCGRAFLASGREHRGRPARSGDAARRIERLRRAIEGDRFGLVAHVLMTRGCTSTDCPDLKLVRDTSRIMSNMRSRAFDAHVNVHALAWHPGGVTVNTLAPARRRRRDRPRRTSWYRRPARDGAATGDQPSVSAMQPPPFIPQRRLAAAPAVPEQPMASGGSALRGIAGRMISRRPLRSRRSAS